jgi:ssRNA-specific RNase YbeY (16S rRNA maturation enzyme)
VLGHDDVLTLWVPHGVLHLLLFDLQTQQASPKNSVAFSLVIFKAPHGVLHLLLFDLQTQQTAATKIH